MCRLSSSIGPLKIAGHLIFMAWFLVLNSSCASHESTKNQAEVLAVQQSEKTAMELSEAKAFSEAGNCIEALPRAENFLRTKPISTFRAEALFIKAKCEQTQGHWSESKKLLLEVISLSKGNIPATTGAALFQLSIVADQLGDLDLASAALLDAESYSSQIDPLIADLAIPARKSAQAYRKKDFASAIALSKEVKAKWAKYQGTASKAELAPLLLVLGNVPLDQVDNQNFNNKLSEPASEATFETTIDTFEQVQNFLWMCMKTEQEPFASRASEALNIAYAKFWNVSRFQSVEVKGADNDAAQIQAQKISRQRVSRLLRTFESLRNFVGSSELEEQKQGPLENRDYLVIESDAKKFLYQFSDSNPMTKEALERNAPKKKGIVYSKPFFKNEKAGSGQDDKKVPSKLDPNLNELGKSK